MGRRHLHGHSHGFSLVELLVAMALGLVLTLGMISVFLGNKRSTELNNATADMQESVRFAMNAIASDVRMAGHQGCAPLDGGALSIRAATVPMSNTGVGLTATAVSGAVVQSASSWSPTLPLGSAGSGGFGIPTTPEAVPGTHVLALQFGEAATLPLAEQMGAGTPSLAGAVVADGEMVIRPGDYAIVSNCFGADLFVATGVTLDANGRTVLTHNAGPNVDGNLTEAYGSPATLAQTRVMRFASNVYFVGDTGLSNDSGDPITALYQQSLPYGDPNNPPTELIRGVENLRLSFGVESGLGQLQYMAPSGAVDSSRIRAVRIGLLLSSFDRIAQQDDEATYMLAGQAIPPATNASSDPDGSTHPGDRRFRLAFNTTVKVRNYR